MRASSLQVGDRITVFACGLAVDVRTVARVTARKVVDEHGGQWTRGGEAWGLADRAVDGNYMRPAEPADDERVRFNNAHVLTTAARIRSRLRQVRWFSAGNQAGVPSDATVARIWEILVQDPEFTQGREVRL